ncbi:hypothetical protein F383_35416 [Gossypium arboreum]|uniref:Uncharacterized protein n=1 Tax=Gossypium arboreum TaxID=29729 RepID=A0A0B0N6S8_GOSAR|nr:hypothetical protein F383_35428 [Gossypium arboreum]KHG08729.1 hypothetical protein F383_35416 [Gossypium arboreum]
MASLCALKIAIHTCVPSRVLSRSKPVRCTDLCYMAKSHARV